MDDPRNHALQCLLEEVVGGHPPPDLRERIHARAARAAVKPPPARASRSVVALAIAGLVAAALVGVWVISVGFPRDRLSIAVVQGSMRWISTAGDVTVTAGNQVELAVAVGDRFAADRRQLTVLELGSGTLECAAGAELEVITMTRTRTVALGAVTLALITGTAAWCVRDTRTPLAVGDRFATTAPPVAAGRETPRERAPAPAPAAGGRVLVPGETVARVKGRCVGTPGIALAGVRVTLHAYDGHKGGPSPRSPGWRPPEPLTTSSDGAFAASFAAAPELSFELTLLSDDHVGMRAWIETAQPGEEIDLGDIVFARGGRVLARVVDEQARALASLDVQLVAPHASHPSDRRVVDRGRSGGRTDGDGRLITRPLAPGDYAIEVPPTYRVVRPRAIRVPGEHDVEAAIVVRPPSAGDSIQGTVVDELGEPVASVSLAITGGPERTFGDVARSVADGRFTFRRGQTLGEPLAITVVDNGNGYTLLRPVTVRWGDEDVRVVVKRPITVRVRVVEAGTAMPVTDYALRIAAADRGVFTSANTATRAGGHHPGGEVRLTDVPAGEHAIVVFPRDGELVASEPRHFTAAGPMTTVDVEVPRRSHTLTVRAVRPDSSPAAGIRVELLRREGAGNQPLTLRTHTCAPDDSVAFSTSPVGIVVASGVTGEDGAVVLRAPPRPAGYAVKLPGPGHVPQLCDGIHLSGAATTVDLLVSAGATVAGQFVPADAWAKLRSLAGAKAPFARLQLASADGQHHLPADSRTPITVGDGGAFRCEGLAPGDWTLLAALHFELDGQPAGAQARAIASGLREGETRRVEVDVSALLPGTLRGRVLLDGETYADRPVFVNGIVVRTDRAGGFTVRASAGGGLLAVLPRGVPDDAPFERCIIRSDLLNVPANGVQDGIFAFTHRVLRLRILEADGTPATERAVRVALSHELQPDAEGMIVVDPAPVEPFAVHTRPRGAIQETAGTSLILLGENILLPAGEREVTLELRIPADR